MDNVKVSVIIPTFNDEKFIIKCIDSVLEQTLKEIEIIVINDGSSDSTEKIMKGYTTKYPQKVTYFEQENSGQGIARNLGVNNSKGEYIAFVDSDDWIEKEMLKTMYENAKKYDSDIVICDFYLHDTIENVGYPINGAKFTKSCKFKPKEYLYESAYTCSPCNKIYRSSLWKGIYNFRKIGYEDLDILPTLYSHCKNFYYVKEVFYNINHRADSSSRTYKNVKQLDLLEAFNNNLNSPLRNPEIVPEIEYYVAREILCYFNNHYRIYTAEYIEFIQENQILFQENRLISKNQDTRKIFDYMDIKTIPKKIFYPKFKNEQHFQDYDKCIASWKQYTRDFEFIILSEENCSIDDAPECVKLAYINKDYKFVGDYFKLLKLHEEGGFALDKNMELTSPIGLIRAEKITFGFKDKSRLTDTIFGCVANHHVIKEILESYKSTKLYKNNDEPLSERIEDFLTQRYGLILNGTNQILNDNIKVYAPNIMMYDLTKDNISKIHYKMEFELEKGFCVVDEKSLIEFTYINECETKQLQEELKNLKKSRAWKLVNFLKKFAIFR